MDPAAEHIRYKEEEDTSEARAARRDARLTVRFAELEQQQQRQTARWRTPKDILDD